MVTIFTAGVQSIQMWWQKPETDPTQIFLVKLACVLAGIMLTLTVIITLDTVRRWYVLLYNGRAVPAGLDVQEPA